jgi:polyferredoxin
MTMTHPGLPMAWAAWVMAAMAVLTLWSLLAAAPGEFKPRRFSFQHIPLIGNLFRYLVGRTWPLLLVKVIFALIFILVIIAGLWGTVIPERNLATALTWNLWWSAIIIAVVFTGSAWCAVCPWDTIASWLAKHRLWRRSESHSLLRLSVPKYLRNLWPAIILFVGLSWLELGVGVTTSPYATALMAIFMVLAATLAMVLFKDKAFCRYFCPVGRTVGVYSQLSPVALRPVDEDICHRCDTLDCYHGSPVGCSVGVDAGDVNPGNIIADTIDACPTRLVMGRLQESTYCTSCGNCTQSCPSQNINWVLRSPSVEAIQEARPHVDEAFFMLTLLSLTSFHGLTMLEGWQALVSHYAQIIGDSGQLLLSFTSGLVASWLLPIGFFYLMCVLCVFCSKSFWSQSRNVSISIAKVFSGFAFVCIPLAFSYHIAHNLNHLLRETGDWSALLVNPLGMDTLPLSMMEKHLRHSGMWLSQNALFTLQALLLAVGCYLAVQVIRYRGQRLFQLSGLSLIPLLLFAMVVTGFNLWLLMQDMVMRM